MWQNSAVRVLSLAVRTLHLLVALEGSIGSLARIFKFTRRMFSGMGAATIFGAKQVQGIYKIFDFFSLLYIMIRHISHNVQRHEQHRTQLGIVRQKS